MLTNDASACRVRQRRLRYTNEEVTRGLRTLDLKLGKLALCRTELWSHAPTRNPCCTHGLCSPRRRQDSNLRYAIGGNKACWSGDGVTGFEPVHPTWKDGTLPAELHPVRLAQRSQMSKMMMRMTMIVPAPIYMSLLFGLRAERKGTRFA